MSRWKREQARSSKQAKPVEGKGLRDGKLRRNEASSSLLPAPLNEDTPSTRNRTGLPEAAKSGIELLSGISMDDVRVHYNSERAADLASRPRAECRHPCRTRPGAARLPRSLARCSAGSGAYHAHEADKRGAPVNEDESLEHDADVMGARAIGSGAHSAAPAEEQKPVGTPGPVTRTGSEHRPLDAKKS